MIKRPLIGSRWWAASSAGQSRRPAYQVTGTQRGIGSIHGRDVVTFKNVATNAKAAALLLEWHDLMVQQ